MNWFTDKGIKCVVLCAGRGARIDPKADRPKSMFEVNGRPLLEYVINYWKNFTDDFIFVVNYKKEQIVDFVKKLPIKSEFIEQKELKGIADALSFVEDKTADKFILVLGDCWCDGNFLFPQNMIQGVGVWETDKPEDIKRSYSVAIGSDDLLEKVVEKPEEVKNNLCGTGFYFFNKKVFDYIKITPPSVLRGEIEITDVIQNMISAGEKITPVFFNGFYVNVNLKQDLEEIQRKLNKNRR